jgi:3-oxoadipate enol-lactonase
MNAFPTRTAEINGVPIAYDMAGDGSPIVLLHAGIADRRMWGEQMSAFAADHRVIRYDLRGFGGTPMPANAFSHRRDLRDLLARLDAMPAVIVGCSFGGKMALEAVLEFPEIARALVLVNAPLGGYEWGADLDDAEAEIEAAFLAGDFDRAAEVDLRTWVDGPQRTPEQVDPAFRARAHMLARHVYEVATDVDAEREPFEPAASERLGDVHVPTLVIAGALDQPEMLTMTRVMADGIANARLVTMPDTAHLPSMERPAEFNRLLRKFLLEVAA